MKKDTQDMQWKSTVLKSLAENIKRRDMDAVVYRDYETIRILNEVAAGLALQQKPAVLEGERVKALEDNCEYCGMSIYICDEPHYCTAMLEIDELRRKLSLQSSAVEALTVQKAVQIFKNYLPISDLNLWRDMLESISRKYPHGIKIITDGTGE